MPCGGSGELCVDALEGVCKVVLVEPHAPPFGTRAMLLVIIALGGVIMSRLAPAARRFL